MTRPQTDKPRSAPEKPTPAAPSDTELQKQRADWEGMAPTMVEPERTPQNEGEGNRTADRSYRKGVKQFLEEGRSEEAADEAAEAIDSEEGEELRRAEELGKAKKKA